MPTEIPADIPAAHLLAAHVTADVSRRHGVRASQWMRGAVLAFICLAAGSVFQCVSALSGLADAGVAALTAAFALGASAYRGERRQPIAFEIGQDGLTTWNRAGHRQYRRIVGCAQWSNALLALTLLSATNQRSPFLVAADALDTHAFRELAVRARRCSQEHL
ncbi:protein YgfX [Caballeronia sp.]|uniref:protein YgfX n=1 Tax=Caballeronia sp. TaxID=1931223 RepID=UPI003C331B1D